MINSVDTFEACLGRPPTATRLLFSCPRQIALRDPGTQLPVGQAGVSWLRPVKGMSVGLQLNMASQQRLDQLTIGSTL